MGGDELAILVEETAALGEDCVQGFDRCEVAIDDRFVDEWPEVFGRLQFRRIGRQVDEADAVRHREAGFGVPSGSVEHQDDDAFAPCADRAGEVREQPFEERLVNAVRQIPDGLAAGRLHERRDVEPLIAMMPRRDRPLADRRPNAAMDRLQAEPMLIRRPHLDRLVGMPAGFLDQYVGELFLKASSSSGVADFGFFGRGSWIDQPSFFSASQPRGA